MEIEKALDIVREYGKYMENSKVVHMAFEDNLPFPKLEILDAVWTLIAEEDFSKYANPTQVKDSLYIGLMDLLKHFPRPEEYSSLIEYQQNLSNPANKSAI